MRLAVLADIHGNRLALERVVADLASRNVDAVINLGDCVSGPLWPRETLDLLRASAWPTVRGNHDRVVGEGERDAMGPSDRYAFDALDASGREWLRTLPRLTRLADDIVAMHARPDNDDAYLIETQRASRLDRASLFDIVERLGFLKAAVVLTAHSHLPAIVALPDGPLIVNPGSVGCPAYSDESTRPPHVSEAGHPGARYAIVDTGGTAVSVETFCLAYDHRTAARRATDNGRPDWAYALTTGFALPDIESTA